jgi:hypothetical protein
VAFSPDSESQSSWGTDRGTQMRVQVPEILTQALPMPDSGHCLCEPQPSLPENGGERIDLPELPQGIG